MPKTDDFGAFQPERVDPDAGLKKAVAKATAKDKITLVKLQCLFPAHVIYAGAVSGQRYDFSGPGSVLEVDSRDVPAMLAYRIGTTSCCGGGNLDGNTVFQIV